MTPKEKARIINLYREGYSIRNVAEMCHHSPSFVYSFLKRYHEIEPGRKRKGFRPSDEQKEMLAKWWEGGVKTRVIAECFGIPKSALQYYLDMHRDEYPCRIKRFEPTMEQLDHMREMWDAGETVTSIARYVGWSYPAVYTYIHRHRTVFARREGE